MPDWGQKHAEPLDGPFVSGLREATRGRRVTVVCTVQAKIANESRYANDLLVIQNGELRLTYQKIHLYDAFRGKESSYAAPGDVLPQVLQIGPFKVGFLRLGTTFKAKSGFYNPNPKNVVRDTIPLF